MVDGNLTQASIRTGSWRDAPKGSFVVAPAGTPHDFENRTGERAGALNISVPGDFVPAMEGIVTWFRERSAADARTANAPPAPATTPANPPK